MTKEEKQERRRTRIDDRLFVGGILAYAEPIPPVDVAVNVAGELFDEEDRTVVHFRLRDSEDVRAQVDEIRRAVDFVAATRASGKVVMITCVEGRNRSCLVAAEVLIVEGMAPSEAVTKVKTARSAYVPGVLSNEAFVRWLLRDRANS